jgi:VanZ family protein
MIRTSARIAFGTGVVAVSLLSLLPQYLLLEYGIGGPERDPEADRVLSWLQHSVAYALLAFFAAIGFPRRRAPIAILVGLVVFGCLLEAAQTFIPDRSGSPADAVANATGVLVGLALTYLGPIRMAIRRSGKA